jgi:hypothetical protein
VRFVYRGKYAFWQKALAKMSFWQKVSSLTETHTPFRTCLTPFC